MSPHYEFKGLIKGMTYDPLAGAIYFTLSDNEVSKTHEIDEGVYVDVDANKRLVGIELIRRNALIEVRNAFRIIARRFHRPQLVKIPEALKKELAPLCGSVYAAPRAHASV